MEVQMRALSLPAKMNERLDAAARLIQNSGKIRVVSHYDADGISAATVMAASLFPLDKEFQLSMSRSLDADLIDRIKDEDNDLVIFSDMGSGQLELISSLGCDAIVLDHHRFTGSDGNVIHVNPSSWGFDGSVDACGSTVSFALAVRLDEENWRLAPCALAGAFGDMQHMGGMRGINRLILEESIEKKIISERNGLSLQGENLKEALTYSCEPYFKGYSGREEMVLTMFSSIGVSPDIPLSALKEEEIYRVSNLLSLVLASAGCEYESISQLFSSQFYDSLTGLSILEMSSLANACGRSSAYATGLAMELGDSDALEESRKMRREYNMRMMERLLALEEGIEQWPNIQCFRADDPSLAGALCGLYMSYIGEKSKPTLAYSLSGEVYKISARGTKALVSSGLDLASSLSSSAKKFGGTGGGHVIAAGATVPREALPSFLKEVDDVTGRQLHPTPSR